MYEDDLEGFRGYLAFAGRGAPLAAGGLRVAPGLSGETIVALAEAMALKQRALALNVDGAKCGIDYDPASPGADAALARFMRFLAPHLRARLSLGPDMGTAFEQLERIARAQGLDSVKAAIARAQGLALDDVLARLALLGEPVGALTLGRRRAGHGLAAAARAAIRHVGAGPAPSCAVQGFGTLGRAAALSLHEAGVRVRAVSDERGGARSDAGLDVPALVAVPAGRSPAEQPGPWTATGRDGPLDEDVDVLVLAACEDAVSPERARTLRARAVVVGANLGLSAEVEALLSARGVAVVCDFVAGAGGSASMDALFGSAAPPTARAVLDRTAALVGALATEALGRARESGRAPSAAARELASERLLEPGARPYGLRLLGGAAPEHAAAAAPAAPAATR